MQKFRVWVNVPNNAVRSGYLSARAVHHHPAQMQTLPWTKNAAIFDSLHDAEDAIRVRGWTVSTSVQSQTTAYACEVAQ